MTEERDIDFSEEHDIDISEKRDIDIRDADKLYEIFLVMIDKYGANLIYKPEAIYPIKRKLAEEGQSIGNWPYPIFGGSEWQWTASSITPSGYNYNTVVSDKRRELIRIGKIYDTANIIELCNVIYSIFVGLKYHPEISHITQMLTVCHAVSGPGSLNLDPTIIGEIFLRCCSIIRPLDIRSEGPLEFNSKGPLELDQGLIAVKPTIYDKLIYHIYDIFVTDCKIKTDGWAHHTALYGDKETVLKREQLEREKIKPIPRWLKRKEELKLKEDNIDIKKIIEDHYLTNDICRVVIINEDFVEHTIISPFDYFKHNITKIYNNIFVGYAKEDASFTELYFTYDDIVAHFIPVC